MLMRRIQIYSDPTSAILSSDLARLDQHANFLLSIILYLTFTILALALAMALKREQARNKTKLSDKGINNGLLINRSL
jgi:hypothetical protein